MATIYKLATAAIERREKLQAMSDLYDIAEAAFNLASSML